MPSAARTASIESVNTPVAYPPVLRALTTQYYPLISAVGDTEHVKVRANTRCHTGSTGGSYGDDLSKIPRERMAAISSHSPFLYFALKGVLCLGKVAVGGMVICLVTLLAIRYA